MKCVETFKSRELAGEKQRLLQDKGIDARLMVDPLESYYPALAPIHGVALMVGDDKVGEAMGILRHAGMVNKAG